MVRIVVKNLTSPLFLLEATLDQKGIEVRDEIVRIQNGRLKVSRIGAEMLALADHGIRVHPRHEGLLEEQIQELHLSDEGDAEDFAPEGESIACPDPIQRRIGRAPSSEMKELLVQSVAQVQARISPELIKSNVVLNWEEVEACRRVLEGALQLVYPRGLPDYDPIRMELEGTEDLTGTSASREVLSLTETTLWMANQPVDLDQPLAQRLGRNEKTKVIFRISTPDQGRPPQEGMSPATEKRLQFEHYQRMVEVKKLDRDADESYLNSTWADSGRLKRTFQGLNNISWK